MAHVEPHLKYCPNCAALLNHEIPKGDNRLRAVCPSCKTIHYQNPRLVVGTIPVWEDKILLCKRAIEPRYGFWTLPAGFMENGESTDEGANRETLEEAGAKVQMGPIFSVISVPQIHQVHVFYSAQLLDLNFDAGEESLEVQLFSESQIPWSDIAFKTVSQTLEWYFAHRKGLHLASNLPYSSSLRYPARG